jgi:ABC-type antimicrobial peptide transport system permease subunit
MTLVVFNPMTVAQLFVMVILLGGLMSMAPAWRAMRLNVIKSLKRVG